MTGHDGAIDRHAAARVHKHDFAGRELVYADLAHGTIAANGNRAR